MPRCNIRLVGIFLAMRLVLISTVTISDEIITGRNEVVAKVIFLHLSVIHSVHRGRGGLPQCMLGYHPPGAEPPPDQTPPHPPGTRQTPPRAEPPDQTDPPGAEPPRSRTPPDQTYPPTRQTPLPGPGRHPPPPRK